MIKYKTGDVTKAREKGVQLLVHCVNSGFMFGSGVAVAIDQAFPNCMDEYTYWGKNGELYCEYRKEWIPAELGEAIFVDTKVNNIIVCHCVGQKVPGYKVLGGERIPPVRLWAMKEAMISVNDLANKLKKEGKEVTIIGPEFCGLRAGADFQKDIVPLINEVWADQNVVIYQYEEKKY